MDMKKILQAMDGVAAKPVEGSNDMKKFMSIVTEGANPHKVSLPVQMAMQHYAEPVVEKVIERNESILKKYFAEAEEEVVKEKEEKRALLNQYASKIAQRVLVKEANNTVNELDKSTISKYVKANVSDQIEKASSSSFKSGAAGDKYNKADDSHKEKMRQKGLDRAINKLTKEGEGDNLPDVVSLDVPLLIRLLEYAKEDAQTDMDLHNLAEKLIAFSQEGNTLTMDNYDAIVGDQLALPAPDDENVMEKAPPGANSERMVKHIKAGYAKDGKLTNKEKSIAYATAWKAHNKK